MLSPVSIFPAASLPEAQQVAAAAVVVAAAAAAFGYPSFSGYLVHWWFVILTSRISQTSGELWRQDLVLG